MSPKPNFILALLTGRPQSSGPVLRPMRLRTSLHCGIGMAAKHAPKDQ